MTDWILGHEPAVRLGIFFSVFAVMVIWELIAERRDFYHPRPRRWLANLGLAVIDSVVLRLLFPAAAVGLAFVAEREGWGFLNQLDLPGWLAVVIAVAVLDLTIYLQHVMFHAVPALWRLHMVHHVDQDLDLTTGIRFHPIEIVISMVIKFTVVAALGAPALGVFLFEVLLNATAMFNHGNVRVPGIVEPWLRWIVVTPDMHRVHHSVEIDESNSNFGFNLPWWDRIFGTYRAQPRAGHEQMKLGVEHHQRPEPTGLLRLLALPFAGDPGRYSLGERYRPRNR